MLRLVQQEISHLGCFIQRHATIILILSTIFLLANCIGLKSVVYETRIDRLWFEDSENLNNERSYTKKWQGEDETVLNNQMFVQRPAFPNTSVLTPEALIAHSDVLKRASSVSVDMYDKHWELQHLCAALSFPSFEDGMVDRILEDTMPCFIMTPLYCFWEGSRLIPQRFPIIPNITGDWTNVNPKELISEHRKAIEKYGGKFFYEKLENTIEQAGLNLGFSQKACLNPENPECPKTAENKKTMAPPNVGSKLSFGCDGMASRYMHSPVEAIVGGVKESKTNGEIMEAAALQTIIYLMSPTNLYTYWKNDEVHHSDWSPANAALVLKAWQLKFENEVARLTKGLRSPVNEEDDMFEAEITIPNLNQFSFVTFTSANLEKIIADNTSFDLCQIIVGYIIVALYVVLAMFRVDSAVKSKCSVAMIAVVFILLNTAAGLGMCAMLGLIFNMATSNILPFLSLAIGISDVFVFTKAYAEQPSWQSRPEEQVGCILRKAGINVMLTSMCKIAAFIAAGWVPIPAMRAISMQGGVLMLFHMAFMLLVMPAVISIDIKRRQAGRYDLLWPVRVKPSVGAIRKLDIFKPMRQAVAVTMPPNSHIVTTVLAPEDTEMPCSEIDANKDSLHRTLEDGWPVPQCVNKCSSLKRLAVVKYSMLFTYSGVKVFLFVWMIGWLIFSGINITNLKNGLELKDLVPASTSVHEYFHLHTSYFNFYNMHITTKGAFNYNTKQALLHDFHSKFIGVNNIIREQDGGLPRFWLATFKEWLIDIQLAFDEDWRNGHITMEGWNKSAASERGILGYKLLVQTGRPDHPVDKSQLTKIKLVDSNGNIYSRGFYNYLTAWASHDAVGYSASKANMRPEPKPWYHDPNDFALAIPKAKSIMYAEMPFNLRDLNDTNSIVQFIAEVRDICNSYSKSYNIPCYPSGIPFMFWEQYFMLRRFLLFGVATLLASIILILMLMTVNIFLTTLITAYLVICCVQIISLYSIFGISLSAISGLVALYGLAFCVQPALNISLSFINAIGNRNRRVRLALEHMMMPTLHSTVAAVLSIVVLAFSNLGFIVNHFFFALLIVLIVSCVNSLTFFPLMLSIFGPPGMIEPHEYEDRIATPTPSPPRKRRKAPRRPRRPIVLNHQQQRCAFHCREPSLTTISEESNSWQPSTPEIVVQPKVVLETTTHHYHHNHPPPTAGTSGCPANCPAAQQQCSSPPAPDGSATAAGNSVPPLTSYPHTIAMATTKVKAKTQLEVEVHTPVMMSAGPFWPSASTSSSTSSTFSSSDQSGDSGAKQS
ncbi:Hypothetical predicted protein [Cloeon dipterum]|nr:Hypothetical predicted protein [Cloeon dipterum]